VAKLGEFELLVLLSILRQADAPFANRVREDLEENAGRRVTRGALYRTIDRLTDKGFLTWELDPTEVPERGGNPMRRLSLTTSGMEAVRAAHDVLTTFFGSIRTELEGT
jgi:DNA-binding PadR family transcriptional regulator